MTEFSELMKKRKRTLFLSGALTLPSSRTIPLTARDFVSFQMTRGVMNGQLLGSCLAAQMTCSLANEKDAFLLYGEKRGASLLSGSKLHVDLNVRKEDGSFLTHPLGEFYITSSQTREGSGVLRLEGTDKMGWKLDTAYFDSNTYPADLGSVARSLFRQAGETVNLQFPSCDFVLQEAPQWGNITLRQALSFLCQAAGCFCLVNPQGHFEIRGVKDPKGNKPFVIEAKNVLERHYGENSFGPVNALRVKYHNAPREAEDHTGLFTDQNVVTGIVDVAGNPLFPYHGKDTENLSKNLLSRLSGLSLLSLKTVWQGDPQLPLGRQIQVFDHRNTASLTQNTHEILRFDQGFSMETACTLQNPRNQGGTVIAPNGFINAAYLTGDLNGNLVMAHSLSASALHARTITGEYIAANAIDADHLSAGSVTADKIQGNSITADHLAADSVTADQLKAGSVTADKLKAGSVTADKIRADSVESRHISSGSITAGHIQTGTITSSQLQSHTITADKLKAGLISADSGLIANGAVGTLQIADASVTDGKIVSLTAGKITAGTLDAAKINVVNLKADNITTGTLNGKVIPALGADKIADGSISGVKIVNGAVTTDKIENQAVTADKVVTGAVTADKLAANSVTADKILSGSITTDKLSSFSVTTDKLAAGSITTAKLSSEVGENLRLESNKSIQSVVNHLHAGGNNLLTGTKELTDNIFRTGERYKGFSVLTHRGDQGIGNMLILSTESVCDRTAYVLSFYGKSATESEISCFFYNPNTTLTALSSTGDFTERADGYVRVKLTKEWEKYYIKWTQNPVREKKNILAGHCDAGMDVSLCGFMLEEGNLPGDWAPAPSETEERLQKTESAVSQTPEMIRQQISTLQVGGTNLISGTKALAGNVYLTGETYRGFSVAEFTGVSPHTDLVSLITDQVPSQREYTLSFYGRSVGKDSIFCYFYDPNTTTGGMSDTGSAAAWGDGAVKIPLTEEWKRYSVTWQQEKTDRRKRIIVGRCMQGVHAQICGIKLEEGNKATSWTPSLQDPAEEIKNAAATLTGDEFSVGFDGKTALSVTKRETRVDSDTLTALHIEGDVVNTQEGKEIFLTEGMSIQSAVNNLKKYLSSDVTLHISGCHAEKITLEGFCGKGNLILSFDESGILEGSLLIRNTACRVEIKGKSCLKRSIRGVSPYVIRALNAAMVRVTGLGIQGMDRGSLSAGSCGILSDEGSCVTAEDCLIEKCAVCVKTGTGFLHLANTVGGSSDFSDLTAANQLFGWVAEGKGGCLSVADGKVPFAQQLFSFRDGELNARQNQLIPTVSPDRAAPVTVKTAVWEAYKGYCTYKNNPDSHPAYRNGWVEDGPCQGRLRKDDVWGYSPSYGYGLWILENADTVSATLRGKTIRSACVTVKRTKAWGSTVKKGTCRLRGHAFSAVPEDTRPLLQLFDLGLSASPANGEEVSFALTKEQCEQLKSGALKGFGLASFYDPSYGDYPFMRFEKDKCTLQVAYEG